MGQGAAGSFRPVREELAVSQARDYDRDGVWEAEELFGDAGDPLLGPLDEAPEAARDDDLMPPDPAIDEEVTRPRDEPPGR